MNNNARIFDDLERIAPLIPAPLFWMDKSNVGLGCNDLVLEAIGALKREELIGKTPYDYAPKDIADKITENIEMVVREKKHITFEESVKDRKTGKVKYYLMARSPLFDDDGLHIIGTIVSAIEITALKEKEWLEKEVEKHKVELEKENEFKKVAKQAAHDIRSPLATIEITYKLIASLIPESSRIAILDATTQMSDIANSFLNYGQENKKDSEVGENPQSLMIFLALSQIFSDKKHQKSNLDIAFIDSYNPKCMFTCIKMQPTNFKRMISNLINNAVESLEGKKGTISLNLDLDPDGKNIEIIVQDSGKGMPKEIIDKILNNLQVVTDKKEGHGVGLTQIEDTINRNQGKLFIESKPSEGTKITLAFPIIEPPKWLATKLKFNKGDTIVILDDDRSIHGAWDIRFASHLNEATVKHFMLGNEVIDFVNNFKEKDKIFLLTDFELLKQDIDGIDIIERTAIKKTVLVTSHYAEEKVYAHAAKLGIKILPKQLASEIPIETCEANVCTTLDVPKVAEIVLVEDDRMLLTSLAKLIKSLNKTVDTYSNPKEFIDKAPQYNKDTKFFIDNTFSDKVIGIDLCENLHKLGFAKLYLLSGIEFKDGEIPGYITTILKNDIDALCKIVRC